MRLGEMNKVDTKALNDSMQERVGWSFSNLSKLTLAQASAMLETVDSKIAQVKTTSKLHESEKNAAYNGMVLAKQVLESYLSEATDTHCSDACCGSDVKAEDCTCGPNCKGCNCNAVTEGRMSDQLIDDSENMTKEEFIKKYGKKMADEYYESVNEAEEVLELDTSRLVLEADAAKMIDRVIAKTLEEIQGLSNRFQAEGTLHRTILAQGGKFNAKSMAEVFESMCNELTVAHYDAIGHHNVSEATPMMEDEVGEAEALMAAQDMVDRIQGMLEDVGEMLNEELPPLTDSLRRSAGADAAASFNSSSSETLNSLLEACRSSREAMANNVAALSSGEPTTMGDIKTAEPDAESNLDDDDEVDLDDFEASDAAIGGDEPLGRAKRA
jgi:hypothetical protein